MYISGDRESAGKLLPMLFEHDHETMHYLLDMYR